MSARYGNITGHDFHERNETPIEPVDISEPLGSAARYTKYGETPEAAGRGGRIPRKPAARDGLARRLGVHVAPQRLFLAFSALTVLMIAWVWETTYVRQGMREIERLKDEKLELEKTNEAVRVEITRLSAYDRIGRMAGEHLRLVPSHEKPGVVLITEEEAKLIEREATMLPDSIKQARW